MNEGVWSLWRGLGPNLVGVMPARAIYFSTYAGSKDYLKNNLSINNGQDSPLIQLVSAALAGIATGSFTNPIWVVKTRMQLQTSRKLTKPSADGIPYYRNSMDCFMQICKNEGVKGLFRGLSASYLGIAEGAIQWMAYEQMKKWTRHPSLDRSQSSHAANSAGTSEVDQIVETPLASKIVFNTLGTAGLAKLLAAMITYPHEVLRTRLRQVSSQTQLDPRSGKMITVDVSKYGGLVSCVKTILKEEGALAFYGGMSAHLIRTVPNTAIMFCCYEAIVYSLSPT